MAKIKQKKMKTKKRTSKVQIKSNYSNKFALLFVLAFVLVGGLLVYNAFASVASNIVSFENADTTKCTGGVNTTSGNSSFTPTNTKSYDGTYSALASYTGGTSNAYARCVVTTSWQTGDEVWYGEAVYLQPGFTQSMQQQVDLMRWDNYSLNNTSQDWGGIIIENHDKLARLKRFNVYNDAADLSPTFTIPEGRWVWLEVHQKFSPTNGQAYNEVYMDNSLISASTTANTYGRDITRIRYGLVAIGAGSQTNPLSLYVDRATISTTKLGPVSGNSTGTASDTTPPSSPTNLSANAVNSSQINLAWLAATDNVGVTGYKVYRGGSLVASLPNTALSWSNSGLNSSTSYSYQVTASDSSGNESLKSATVSATTLAAQTTTPTASSSEGESFIYKSASADIYSDSKASGGKDLRIKANGSANKSVQTSTASKATLRLRAWACSAKPNITLYIDGQKISTASISNTRFYDFTVPVAINPGVHTINISASNIFYSSGSCGNSIHFDKITFS